MKLNAAVLSATTTLLVAGCVGHAGDTSAGPIQVSIRFEPNPIRMGAARLVVTVADSSGHAVNGANVTVITSMPVMKMNVPMPMSGMGMAGTEYRAKDRGDGSYIADVAISAATTWVFVAHAKTKDSYGTAVYEARIGPAAH